MILPGSTVKVIDENSIYRGYVGCVQRIQGKKAAVLMDSHTPWDKMITFRISSLDEVTEGFQYYPKKKWKKTSYLSLWNTLKYIEVKNKTIRTSFDVVMS